MNKTYRIETIADLFEKIPEHRVDAFLVNLGNIMRSHKVTAKALSELAQSKVKSDFSEGFEWVDDGQHNMSVMICRPVQAHYDTNQVGDGDW